MKYPVLAKELIALLQIDQQEIKQHARHIYSSEIPAKGLQTKREQLRDRSRERARRMLEILDIVSAPTMNNLGAEASEAVSVIALHSSLDTMKKVLELFSAAERSQPDNVYKQAIPALVDRVLILEGHKQKFGTQWLRGEDGQPFLYPIDGFGAANKRRAQYGLKPMRRPRIVALTEQSASIPNDVPARQSDQREPTRRELQEYSQDYLL